MRILPIAGVLCVLGGSIAVGSEPGEPLDCSDIVFLEPGLTCTEVVRPCGGTTATEFQCGAQLPSTVVDNEGNLFSSRVDSYELCGFWNFLILELIRFDGVAGQAFATIDERCVSEGPPGIVDALDLHGHEFDPMNGRFYFIGESRCVGGCTYEESGTDRLLWLGMIEGFPTLPEVLGLPPDGDDEDEDGDGSGSRGQMPETERRLGTGDLRHLEREQP